MPTATSDNSRAVMRNLKLVRRVLEDELQRLAVDANLCDLYHLHTPHTDGASEMRVKVNAALEFIDTLIAKEKASK